MDDDPIEFYDDLYDMGDDEDVPMAASSSTRSVTRGTAPPASTSVPRAKAPMSAAPRVAQASINDNEDDDNETRLYKKMQALRDEVYLIFFVVWNACND